MTKEQPSAFGFIEEADKILKDKELAKTPLLQSMMAQICFQAEAICWAVVLGTLFGNKQVRIK